MFSSWKGHEVLIKQEANDNSNIGHSVPRAVYCSKYFLGIVSFNILDNLEGWDGLLLSPF